MSRVGGGSLVTNRPDAIRSFWQFWSLDPATRNSKTASMFSLSKHQTTISQIVPIAFLEAIVGGLRSRLIRQSRSSMLLMQFFADIPPIQLMRTQFAFNGQ